MCEATFYLSANSDWEEFKRIVADYFVIPNYQRSFNFYDWLGYRIDSEFKRLSSVPAIMNAVRDRGVSKDSIADVQELNSILNPDGKRYNMLYFGTSNFKKSFDSYVQFSL